MVVSMEWTLPYTDNFKSSERFQIEEVLEQRKNRMVFNSNALKFVSFSRLCFVCSLPHSFWRWQIVIRKAPLGGCSLAAGAAWLLSALELAQSLIKRWIISCYLMNECADLFHPLKKSKRNRQSLLSDLKFSSWFSISQETDFVPVRQ